mmetsp:Transcript_24486/g.32452  ORF Transcript_24486/g.32452 Transcript_24486/m.32452 type:complete len:95 (-) Transcript_24486:14-298(-)
MPSALASDSLGVSHLIRAYQVNGHHAAKLDPLNLYARESFPNHPINTGDIIDGLPSYLTPSHHGFDPQKDMDRLSTSVEHTLVATKATLKNSPP